MGGFDGGNVHVTCFVGFLPTLLSVSHARGTGDSGASFSRRTRSVRKSFIVGSVALTGRTAPKCLFHILRGLGTPKIFPVTENLTPAGSVTGGVDEQRESPELCSSYSLH